MKLKLIKVHPGRYVTQDQRFTITRKKFTDTWWLIEDRLGRIGGMHSRHTLESYTLAEARENIADQLEYEEERRKNS